MIKALEIALCVALFLYMQKNQRPAGRSPWEMLFWGQKKYLRFKEVDVIVKHIEYDDQNRNNLVVVSVPSIKKYAVLHNAFYWASQEIIESETICKAYQYKIGNHSYILDSAPVNVPEGSIIPSAQKEQMLQSKVETVRSFSCFLVIAAAVIALSNVSVSFYLAVIAIVSYLLNVPFLPKDEWDELCDMMPQPSLPASDGITDTMPEGYEEWTDVRKFLYKFDKRYSLNNKICDTEQSADLPGQNFSQDKAEEKKAKGKSAKTKKEEMSVQLSFYEAFSEKQDSTSALNISDNEESVASTSAQKEPDEPGSKTEMPLDNGEKPTILENGSGNLSQDAGACIACDDSEKEGCADVSGDELKLHEATEEPETTNVSGTAPKKEESSSQSTPEKSGNKFSRTFQKNKFKKKS